MHRTARTHHTAPRHVDGEPRLSRDGHAVHDLFRQPPDSRLAVGTAVSPVLSRLITPTWAEVDEARENYAHEAKRLRFWRWWFVGMFAFYTALVGMLVVGLLGG